MCIYIDIEFTKILSEFKQKQFVDLFRTCNFKFIFQPSKFFFGNFLNTLLIKIFLYFDYKFKTHCRIISVF